MQIAINSLFNIEAFAQHNLKYGQIDTLELFTGDKLLLKDTTFLYNKDTIIYIPSIAKYRIVRNPYTKSENFYKNLHKNAQKNKLTKKAYSLILRKPRKNHKQETSKISIGTSPFSKFKGYYIKNIRIKKLETFGTSVADTTQIYDNWTTQKINKLHINTRTKIIKNVLLFKEGDKLNPISLSESERLLRSLPYIKDAKIIATTDETGEYVNITVITKDVWTLGAEVIVKDINYGEVDVYNKNIFGLGHQISNAFYYNLETKPSNGYNGYYRITNINGSFINTELSYYNRYGNDILKLSLSRSFVTPEIKYAGGITLFQAGSTPINNDNTTLPTTRYNYFDTWIAHSFSFGEDGESANNKKLIVSGRTINKIYFQRPEVFIDSNQAYYNKSYLLGSIGISQRNYYKSNLIYNYGRTEDIPYGYEVKGTFGTMFNDFNTKLYGAIDISGGNYFDRFGYFYFSTTTGSFINDKIIEKGMLNLSFKYFTPIITLGSYKLRNFINLNLTYGINRLSNEGISINKGYGIRDFVADTLLGKNRFKFSYEVLSFTPIYFFGFRFAAFSFIDIATLGDKTNFMFTEKYYSGIGLGLRIRNENLIFNAFEIKFVYFPVMPADKPQSVFYLSNERPTRFNDFSLGAPGIVSYR